MVRATFVPTSSPICGVMRSRSATTSASISSNGRARLLRRLVLAALIRPLASGSSTSGVILGGLCAPLVCALFTYSLLHAYSALGSLHPALWRRSGHAQPFNPHSAKACGWVLAGPKYRKPRDRYRVRDTQPVGYHYRLSSWAASLAACRHASFNAENSGPSCWRLLAPLSVSRIHSAWAFSGSGEASTSPVVRSSSTAAYPSGSLALRSASSSMRTRSVSSRCSRCSLTRPPPPAPSRAARLDGARPSSPRRRQHHPQASE